MAPIILDGGFMVPKKLERSIGRQGVLSRGQEGDCLALPSAMLNGSILHTISNCVHEYSRVSNDCYCRVALWLVY